MYASLCAMVLHCDPFIYFHRVRPYIHGWKNNPSLPNGLIYEVVLEYGRQGQIRVRLKYGPRGEMLIHHLERVSRTGCRIYRSVEELPRPMSGLGIAIVSTSYGVMSDRECREKRIGGEVVATVG